MRVVVTTHHHFRMLPDGTVYPYSVFDYTFWHRYLDVFDEVVVFARLERIGEADPATMPAKSNGPGVTFFELPDFLGPWQYLKYYTRLTALAKDILQGNDAYILRIPSFLSMALWRGLMKTKRPYGVEVTGDPWQALSPGSHQSMLRPIIRLKLPTDMVRQCRHAAVAAYVTQQALQERYPPGGWSTYYSSIELSQEFIIDQAGIEKRLKTIETRAKSNGPWRLCFVGSLWHLCKSPDILIDAVADCVKRGLNLKLTIVGGGSLREQLEEQARQRRIAGRIRFLGQLPPGKVIFDQLDRSDLYVLPSRSEGMPRTIIEAMARGLPCIGGHEGGFAELLDDEYIVKPVDAATLSCTIERTLSDIDGMKRAVKRNAKKAAEYRSDILQKRRIELYRRLKDITQHWLNNPKKE